MRRREREGEGGEMAEGGERYSEGERVTTKPGSDKSHTRIDCFYRSEMRCRAALTSCSTSMEYLALRSN